MFAIVSFWAYFMACLEQSEKDKEEKGGVDKEYGKKRGRKGEGREGGKERGKEEWRKEDIDELLFTLQNPL